MNELDQFVKRELKCAYYLRYVDDFILLDKEKEKLKFWRDSIVEFLEANLQLELSPHKEKILPVKAGVDFLGYFVKPDYMLVRKRVVKNAKAKLYNAQGRELRQVLATVNSYYGHFSHASSFNLRKEMYENGWGGGLQRLLKAKPGYTALTYATT